MSAVSSNLTLLPNANITISGSGSNRFLTLTPAPNQNGLALISLTVSDPLTNTTTTFLLTVTPVADPPIVTLAAPTNSAVLTNTVALAATVSDPDNDAPLVEFYANGAKVGQASNLPWTATWTNPPVGYYQVLAIATDATGLSATSSPAFITVQWSLQTLVSSNSVWKYSDQGLNLSNAWRAPAYDESLWPSGPAPLGYGDANGTYPRTTNSFGTNSANKYITTYYRRAFVVPDAPAWSNATVTMQRDDGAVVYLNGTEIFRSNMTNAAIDYLTRALTTVSTTGETTWYSTNFNAALLHAGTNVLAVEIHQDKPDSSDIWLDLKLTAQPALAAPKLQAGAVSGGSVLRWPSWAGGLHLFFATNLTGTAVWQPETQPAVWVDGQWTLIVPPLANTTRFYRLEYP